MKTHQTINADNAASTSYSHLHSMLVAAGVVIAIVCALILLQNFALQYTPSKSPGISSLSYNVMINAIAEVKSVVLFR